jgi:hypothetical protein
MPGLCVASGSTAAPMLAPHAYSLQGRLLQLGILRPSPVQEAAIPKVLAGSNVAIQSYTGSGKVVPNPPPLLGWPPTTRQILLMHPERVISGDQGRQPGHNRALACGVVHSKRACQKQNAPPPNTHSNFQGASSSPKFICLTPTDAGAPAAGRACPS